MITREEFESGVPFVINRNPGHGPYKFHKTGSPGYITEEDKHLCNVNMIYDVSFTFYTSVLGKSIRGRISFENCTKVELKETL